MDLLGYLCQYKSSKKAKQPDYLLKFLGFCVQNLEQYKTQGGDWRVKEALLYAIGSLVETIAVYPKIKSMMEQMMSGHVLPELENP